MFQSFGLVWGPTGSAGFELASAVATLSASSDLDAIVRVDRLPCLKSARALWQALARCAVRVDCLIELPAGGLSLSEYADGGAVLGLRTALGPQLLFRPVAPRAAARRAAAAIGAHASV